MRIPTLWAAMLVAAALTLSNPAIAGRACQEVAPDVEQTLKATRMAELTLDKLSTLPDKLVLLGRVGQDLSKYGLDYSHMAFAVRQPLGWNVVHELNTCGTAESSLYEQGMVDFFSDSPFKYQAGIWRLSPMVQERLLRAINGRTAKRMHEAKYSVLAYPFSTKYQNSNTWVLEVLAFALAPEDDVATRTDAQRWLKENGYIPTQLEIGAMTRLGARLTRANIAFDDHPDELRWNGKIQTVTVASVIAFLGKIPNVCDDSRCAGSNITLSAANDQALWYVGTFRAEMADGRGVTQYTVQCANVSTCEVAVQQDLPKSQQPARIVSLQVKPFDNHIANSNLETTRSAVQRDASLYSDPNFGSLLRALRPLLESGNRLEQCIDVSKDGDAMLALCRAVGAGPSMPVLLLVTMNSRCGGLPFCAYYFIPLSSKRPSDG